MIAVTIEITITNVVYALAGVGIGFLIASIIRPSHEHHPVRARTIRIWIACLVIGLVTLSIIVDALVPTYDPPAAINTAMTAIATFLFTRNGKEGGET